MAKNRTFLTSDGLRQQSGVQKETFGWKGVGGGAKDFGKGGARWTRWGRWIF